MTRILAFSTLLVGLTVLLLCEAPPRPPDPVYSVGINKNRPFTPLDSLRDSLAAGRSYLCAVGIDYPGSADSFLVRLSGTGVDSVIYGDTLEAADTVKSFFLPLISTGSYTLVVTVVTSVGRDSMIRDFVVYEPVVSHITALRPTSGTFTLGTAFACTASVSLPAQADSFYAHVVYGSVDSLVDRGRITGATVAFSVPVVVTGNFGLKVKIKRSGGTYDSAQTTYTGKAMSAPTATPDSAMYRVYLHDSVTVSFSIADPDSNLWQCSTWVAPSPRDVKVFSFPPLTGADTIIRVFLADSLGAGPHECHAQAIDFKAQTSTVVSCSVLVIDTIRPDIQVLPPYANATNAVSALPITLRALITDDSPIDSARFNKGAMAFSGDTALIEVTTLPIGVSADTIVAWDHGRVSDTVIVRFDYTGPVKYPPQVRPMSRTVAEGGKIDTIWLDTCVALTLPATQVPNPVAYKRDSLTWQVLDETGMFTIKLDSPRHRVYVALPDTQLRIGQAVSEVITFRVTDNRGESDAEFGAFVMTGVNAAPVVTIANQSVCYDAPFDTLLLDTSFEDAEDAAGQPVEWEFTGGRVFMASTVWKCPTCPPPPQVCLIKCTPTKRIAIIPDPTKIAPDSATKWRGTDSLHFRVKDTDGAWSPLKLVTFTRKASCLIIIDPIRPSFPKTAVRREE